MLSQDEASAKADLERAHCSRRARTSLRVTLAAVARSSRSTIAQIDVARRVDRRTGGGACNGHMLRLPGESSEFRPELGERPLQPETSRARAADTCLRVFSSSSDAFFGPVALQQPRERAVGEQLAAGLAAGAVVRFVLGVADALHGSCRTRGTACRSGRARPCRRGTPSPSPETRRARRRAGAASTRAARRGSRRRVCGSPRHPAC